MADEHITVELGLGFDFTEEETVDILNAADERGQNPWEMCKQAIFDDLAR